MCNYQKLAYNENGYIIKCAACNSYYIAFHTSSVYLSHKNFICFIEILKDKIAEGQVMEFPVKNIYVPTPAQGYGLILTYTEAIALLEMCEQAEAEAVALRMLQLFED